MRFTLFDRWGTQIGVINDVISAIHTDELNGEDSLTLTLASCNLVKGNRIVWRDKFGVWHEHIVNDLKDVHEEGRMYTVAYCENSLAELFSDYIEELRPYNVTATVALQRALSVTRWGIGSVGNFGNGSASFYHISAREALTLITENWGGELSATIAISGTKVSSRSVNITSRGADHGKRFEWSKDLRGITREVSTDDVCTALYGYGKGLEAYDEDGTPTGGYERKLTFGEINNNLDYVADEDAKQVWGLPDGNGGKKHAFGKVEFPDCEDMGELLTLTTAELQRRKQPKVSYTASVIDLADAGFAFEDVQTGDAVAIIDRELGERLTGRVLCVQRDLFNESETIITLGNIVRTIHDVISDQLKGLNNLRDHSAAWDGAASISESYINGVIRVWNATMNATGGYVYQEPGEGITVYDKPEDENPTMAIQLKGAGFRIANSRTGNDWNWRTFGTGDGFTADCLNVGTIRGGSNYWNLETGDLLFKSGGIRSADNSSYWNMTTGEICISSSATIGGETVSSVLGDITQLQGDLEVTAEQFSVDMTALTTRVGTNETDIAALKLSAQQFSVDISANATAVTQIKATYGTCSTGSTTAAKAVTCADFALRVGAAVTVKFTYKNTASNPTLNVNSTGAKAIYLNGSALPESAYWGAGETMTFIYDGTNWVVTDGAATAQILTNSSDIASLKVSAQQFSVDISSHSDTLTQLKAVYCTCSTTAATQAKVATCADFALRTGAIIAVKFTYKNTAANPTLNVNSTGAKAIYLNGSALPESAYWGAGDIVTLVYDGANWCVADGSTLTQLVTTNSNVASLTLRADSFDVSIKGIQSTYATCSTAAATQVKEVTLANFTKFVGQTVTVKFSNANESTSYPKLKVQNSDASVVAEGYILVNNSYMASSQYWAANGVVTFVWDGTYWRVGDGSTLSQIKVLRDSITLSVSNGSLGNTASIKLEIDGRTDQTKTIDLTGVRNAFKNDTSAITITAGTVTFNSDTIAINATNFTLSSSGAVTANSFTGYGWFQCGSTSGYHIILNSSGEMEGYNGSTRYGYIDFAGSTYDLTDSTTKYGMQMQARQMIRISSPKISVASSSNVSTTATWAKTGTLSQQLVKSITDDGGGSISWRYGTMQISFICGLCTSWSVVT